jgi:hypothetical protein
LYLSQVVDEISPQAVANSFSGFGSIVEAGQLRSVLSFPDRRATLVGSQCRVTCPGMLFQRQVLLLKNLATQ